VTSRISVGEDAPCGALLLWRLHLAALRLPVPTYLPTFSHHLGGSSARSVPYGGHSTEKTLQLCIPQFCVCVRGVGVLGSTLRISTWR